MLRRNIIEINKISKGLAKTNTDFIIKFQNTRAKINFSRHKETILGQREEVPLYTAGRRFKKCIAGKRLMRTEDVNK